jgi:hypothetical protein
MSVGASPYNLVIVGTAYPVKLEAYLYTIMVCIQVVVDVVE